MGMTTQAAGAGFKAGGAYKSAEIQKSQLNDQAWADRQNAQIATWQAGMAITNGQTQEESSRLQTAALVGRERAALGASGVDLGTGSANDILTSSKVLGERDALQIHDNALRAAWGYQQESIQFKNKAALEHAGANTISPGMAAIGSLLGSASSSGFDYSQFMTPGVTQGSNPYGYNGTQNNPSAYVGG